VAGLQGCLDSSKDEVGVKNWFTILGTFLLVIFVRIVVTKEQTVLMALSSGRYGEAWLGLKALLPTGSPSPYKVVRVPANVLQKCAKGYVDTPLYHTRGWLMRWLQWGKLRALWKIKDTSGGSILDFGCGNGVMLPTLAKNFSSVVGYDIHTEAARSLKVELGLDNVEIRRRQRIGSMYVMVFQDEAFDLIWTSSVLEHFKDLDLAIYQLHRVLKPGGQLLCLSPSEDWRYRLGRKLFGLKKPSDHYHTGQEIHNALQEYFSCEVKKTWPPLVGAYVLGRYRK
jgi:ubiquinone/menaquinone biosynthesis C-methylase UbiE